MALGLALAWSPPARAQAPGSSFAPAQSSWWSGLWGGKAKEEAKPAAQPAPTVSDRIAQQDRLMKAFLRRQAVCDELRRVALDTTNDALYDEANRLEDLAFKAYQRRLNKLVGVSGPELELEDEAPRANRPGGASRETVELLRSATPGGGLPPRLRPGGGRIDPPQASRSAPDREEER
jgi:hypothetical protein